MVRDKVYSQGVSQTLKEKLLQSEIKPVIQREIQTVREKVRHSKRNSDSQRESQTVRKT
jgi:hypothetical protein